MNKKSLSLVALLMVGSSQVMAQSIEPYAIGELGVMGHKYTNSDGGKGSPMGAFGSAQFVIPTAADARVNIEVQTEYLRNNSKSLSDNTPGQANLLSARYEKDITVGKVSFFGGVGGVSSHEDDDGVGSLFGASFLHNINQDTQAYVTVGRAIIRVDQDDSGFTGRFGEVGVVRQLTKNIAVKPFLGYGKAKRGYEDTDDAGNYRNMGVKVAFQLSSKNYVIAGYENSRFNAITEDIAKDQRVTLSYVMPFGSAAKAVDLKSALRPLSPSLLPFRAAGYGEALD